MDIFFAVNCCNNLCSKGNNMRSLVFVKNKREKNEIDFHIVVAIERNRH